MIIAKEREYKLKPGKTVKIQRLKDDPCEWCVLYRGNGHYFKTFTEVMNYCERRGWKIPLILWDFRLDGEEDD